MNLVMDDKYIGKGEIKYLDKDQTKLGAFIEFSAEEFASYLADLVLRGENPSVYTLKILPNKANDGYTVKINVK